MMDLEFQQLIKNSKYFDKSYNDFYFKRDTIEQGEIKLIEESVDILLNKAETTKFDIDLFTITEECFNYDDTIGKYDVLSPSEIMFLQSFLCKTEKESDI